LIEPIGAYFAWPETWDKPNSSKESAVPSTGQPQRRAADPNRLKTLSSLRRRNRSGLAILVLTVAALAALAVVLASGV
jgi:hypothetical protein